MSVLCRNGQTLGFAFLIVSQVIFSIALDFVLRLARVALFELLREILITVLFRNFEHGFDERRDLI